MRISPSVIGTKRLIERNKVLFPAPLRPMIETNSPSSIVKLMFCSPLTPFGYTLDTFSKIIILLPHLYKHCDTDHTKRMRDEGILWWDRSRFHYISRPRKKICTLRPIIFLLFLVAAHCFTRLLFRYIHGSYHKQNQLLLHILDVPTMTSILRLLRHLSCSRKHL